MVMKPPSELNQLLLYWWKIIDRDEINKDDLQNFIAFELFTFSLEKTKATIQEAIDRKLLIYDPITDLVRLNSTLQTKYNEWLKGGITKTKKMLQVLRKRWREPLQFRKEDIFSVYYQDLVDPLVHNRASRILSSRVKIDKSNFDDIGNSGDLDNINNLDDLKLFISGKIKGYPFQIDSSRKIIQHVCPEFKQYRAKEKSFCPHLARLILKINLKYPEITLGLLKRIAQTKESWIFSTEINI
ncbi:MAG: hypothetical protein K9W44_03660 [Candidatus Lokiarchaeota archaeon]|nr:hypothetical protein [Candidatus Harpocratesius repetitus]